MEDGDIYEQAEFDCNHLNLEANEISWEGFCTQLHPSITEIAVWRVVGGLNGSRPSGKH